MPRPRVYRREGIVLRSLDYSEADRILTIMTPEGKLRALAKAVRRPTSRKSGHLETLNRVDLMLARGRNLDIITEAEALEEFGLRGDLVRFSYASYFGELVDAVGQEEEESQVLYDVFLDGLRWIAEGGDLALGARLFEWRVLKCSGYCPELYRCLGCQMPVSEEPNYLAPELGGVLCPRCAAAQPDAGPVSVNAQKVLRFLDRSDPAAVRPLRVGQATHAEIERLLLDYLEYTFERRFAASGFLRRLRSNLGKGPGRAVDTSGPTS